MPTDSALLLVEIHDLKQLALAERERAERAEARAGSLEEALQEARRDIRRVYTAGFDSTRRAAGVAARARIDAALAAPRKDGQ